MVTAPFKWPRKLTKAKLLERGILAPLDLVRADEPCVRYVCDDDWSWPRWIARIQRQNGSVLEMEFRVTLRGFGPEMRRCALAWASEEFNVAEWVRTPFGSYVPREVAERVAGGGR